MITKGRSSKGVNFCTSGVACAHLLFAILWLQKEAQLWLNQISMGLYCQFITLQLPELEVQELEEHDGFDDHPLSSKPHSPTMPQASPIKAFLQLLEIAWLNSRRHLELVQSLSKPPQASPLPIQRASVDLEETEEEHKCKNFLNAHHFLNCLCYHLLLHTKNWSSISIVSTFTQFPK